MVATLSEMPSQPITPKIASTGKRFGHDRQNAKPPRPEDQENHGEDGHKGGREAADLRHDEIVVERREQTSRSRDGRPHVRSGEDAGRPPLRLIDLLEHEIRAHRRQFDGDLGLREIAGRNALEFDAPLVGEREHEQFLRDERRVGRNRGAARRAKVAMDTLHIVGKTGHLLDERQRPQLGLEAVHPGERIRLTNRLGRPLEQNLERVDAA